MKCYVAFMRFHSPYFLDARDIMRKVPHATNVYEAIEYLNMTEFFYCHMDLLKTYQDEQIPIRWE